MPKLSFQYVRQDALESLGQFLARRFKYHSREEWEGLVRKGFVKVNGKKVSPEHVLETRHKIVYERPPFSEPEVDPAFRVLYEDDDLLAVSKSGNIPTSPSGKYWDNCLVHVLKRAMGYEWLHAVHRLDRETSGVNLFAKSKAVARTLGREFQRGAVEKKYAALLAGHLPGREWLVAAPLRDALGGEIRIKQAVHPHGREACTLFRLLARLPGASLVEVVPLTGRTHQIRAHAAFAGFPVLGDRLYGASEETFLHWVRRGPRNGEPRQYLHAKELRLAHPVTGTAMTIRDPADPLLERFWNDTARDHASAR